MPDTNTQNRLQQLQPTELGNKKYNNNNKKRREELSASFSSAASNNVRLHLYRPYPNVYRLRRCWQTARRWRFHWPKRMRFTFECFPSVWNCRHSSGSCWPSRGRSCWSICIRWCRRVANPRKAGRAISRPKRPRSNRQSPVPVPYCGPVAVT